MADLCCGADGASLDETEGAPERFRDIPEVRAAAVSGMFLAIGLVVDARGDAGVAIAAYLVGIAVGGWTFVPDTLRALTRRKIGVGTLMTIAGLGAMALGEFAEAASLAFLFSISEALEGFAVARTRRGLRSLLDLVPEQVVVRRDGSDVVIAPSELQVGDLMIVGPGDRLATDGVILAGRSTLDLSAITGESIPVEVEPASEVFAASINGGGVLDVEVTARTAASSLARVVHIVEEAQERKGASQRLAERIAQPLVPAIMIAAATLALSGAIVGDPKLWLGRSLVVLVAAAPCAFAISVPVTVLAAVGASARMGALIKGGAALEALSGVRVIALDKTGTLTRNHPVVVSVVPVSGSTADEVLTVAAALEARSEHPLASAILAAAPHVAEAVEVEAIVGNGITGAVNGQLARLGKPGFIDSSGLEGVAELQASGSTVVLVELDGRLLGAIAVRDELRPETAEVIEALRHLGIGHVVLLTGDNHRTAKALGKEAGVNEVHAELLPADKQRIVEDLRRKGSVAMVGDGINDAPALATADVGIAMGAMGSDVAVEAADVALMGEDLTHLPEVMAHARRSGRIMRQNLALSGAIIAVLVPLAGFGVLSLATVVAAHEIAEVLVIANGVRAGRRCRHPRRTPTEPQALMSAHQRTSAMR